MPVVGAEASGFDVMRESREYDRSLSAWDISVIIRLGLIDIQILRQTDLFVLPEHAQIYF